MALNTTKITDLTETQLAEAEAFLVEFIQTEQPGLAVDLAPGTALREFVVKLCAIYYAINQEDIRRVIDSNSLKKVTEDPTLVDDTVLDNLASNYLIERKASAKASGSVRIILSTKTFTAIPTSLVFTASGLNFRPTRNFSGVRTSGDVLDSSNKLIQAYGSNLYSFVVELICDTPGSAGNLSKGTVFSLSSGQSQITSVIAETNFDGGVDTESNADLIARLSNGISTKNLGSRTAAKAMVLENFPSTVDVSIIGAGDPEMLRDSDNLFGIGVGGKGDILVRPRYSPQKKSVSVEATLVNPTTGVWNVSIPRSDAAGVYRVVSGVDSGNRPIEILILSRGVDTTKVEGLDFTPHFIGGDTGAFSRYQTLALTVRATNDAAGATAGDTKTFTLDVLYAPQIDEISDFVLDRSNRNPGGDYLVRGSTPCEVGIEIKITKGPGDPDVDTTVVAAAVSDAVNRLQFVDSQLGSDLIAQVVRNNVGPRTVVNLPITLTGNITTWKASNDYSDIDNDGILRLIGTNALIVPNRPELGVTPRTVSFMCSPSDVSIQVLPPNL